MRPQSRDNFEIAILCALPREFDAVEAVFDEFYDDTPYGKQQGDANIYRTGRIGSDHIVLTCLPEMGKGSAASVASSLPVSFTGIKLALAVGICGGIPFPSKDTELILGDIIISNTIVEYDFGRQYPDSFQRKGAPKDILGRSNRDIRTLLSILQTHRMQNQFQEILLENLNALEGESGRWRYPGASQDRLFEASYRHKHQKPAISCICAACQSSHDPVCSEVLVSDCDKLGCEGGLIPRSRLNAIKPQPRLHFGSLGSADTVMKSGEHRDRLALREGIIGFEMEGAGISDSLSCLIIKGVCDYADSHKNKAWQDYAAATAACCAKAFLKVRTTHCKEWNRDNAEISLYSESVNLQEGGFDLYYRNLVRRQGQRTINLNWSAQNDARHVADDTSQSQAAYQWKLSGRAASIESYVQSLEQEIRRMGRKISNPIARELLISGANEAIKHNKKDMFSTLQTQKSFRSKSYKTMVGTIIFQVRVMKEMIFIGDKNSTQYKTTTSFIFHPTSWLIRIGLKGFEAAATNSGTGWKYNITPVRAVADDSLVFRFCETGNVDAVRELFELGQASVLDTNSSGWRPLHFAVSGGQAELAKFLVLQGADRTAPAYGSPWSNSSTPASLIKISSGRTGSMELLFLFDDCIEFSGPTGDGWNVLTNLAEFYGRYISRERKQYINDELSFLLHKYHTEMIDYIDKDAIYYFLFFAITLPDVEEIRLILNFHSEAVNYAEEGKWPIIHLIVIHERLSADIVQLFVDRGADLHQVFSGETPTSLSLWFSMTFFAWRDHLSILSRNLEDLMKKETAEIHYPLSQELWSLDTLHDLFSLKPTEAFKNIYSSSRETAQYYCAKCSNQEFFTEVVGSIGIIEPWWEQLKYHVKTRQCICRMLDDFEDTYYFFSASLEEYQYNSAHAGEYPSEDRESDPQICSVCPQCQRLGQICLVCSECGRLGCNNSNQDLEQKEAMTDKPIDPKVLLHKCDSAKHTHIRWRSIEQFYLQQGRWKNHYGPKEYFCFRCLAKLECWDIDGISEDGDSEDSSLSESGSESEDSDSEDSNSADNGSENEDQTMYPMPGAYVE